MSPSYAEATRSQTPREVGEWQVVVKKKKKKKKEVEKEKNQEKKGVLQAQGKPKTTKRSTPTRSGDAIKVSARDGQPYVYRCIYICLWTYRLIPELATWLNKKHGQVGFYLAQALSGHGCFHAYLRHFKKRDDESCRYCKSPVDDAEHTLFACASWSAARKAAGGQVVGARLTPDTMIPLILQSKDIWIHIE